MVKLIKIPLKRRRENKTDYKARFSLLKSDKKRIIIRRTNKYMNLQLVETQESKDKILQGVSSKQLLNEGLEKKLQGSLKSIPACYLIGKYFATKLNKSEDYILDLGMARNVKGSRIFATINGLIDGGLKINVNKDSLPPKERINGSNVKKELANSFKKLNDSISKEKK